MSNKTIQLLATVFHLGYIPPASGTVASFAGVLLFLLFHGAPVFYVLMTVGLVALGFYVSDKMEKIEGKKDPSCVVIDEVAGMLIALLGLPAKPAVVVIAFFLFRAFDMFKIYPAQKLEKYRGGVGIMLDDIVAGIYTNLILTVALYIVGS